MRVSKIYLETTLFNYYFEEDRGVSHESTVALFKEIATGKYDAFTSLAVIDELKQTTGQKRELMLDLLTKYTVTILEYSDEASLLADIYVAEGVIPLKYRTDALHIALATVYGLDMIISLNFHHIVKRKTKVATESINLINGYHPIEIFNPMEVIEHEDD